MKKIVVLLFLFCISFKNVSSQALVAEFNYRCFICSRCSMEMWCPDDMGRDSWDWVGPPTWKRACFNSPEWVEAPRLLQNGVSPDCITVVVVVVIVVSEATMREQCLCQQRPINCAREPSMAKNSSPSRAPKTGAQLRDNPEEREKCVRAA